MKRPGLLWRLLARVMPWPDREPQAKPWQPTGFRYTTDRTYDQDKAEAGVARSRQRSATGRLYPTTPREVPRIDRRRA